MRTISIKELKKLDSTIAAVEDFRDNGWTLRTHHFDMMRGVMAHLRYWHGKTPENGLDDVEQAIVELAPELA